jgi:hypothetical protein
MQVAAARHSQIAWRLLLAALSGFAESNLLHSIPVAKAIPTTRWHKLRYNCSGNMKRHENCDGKNGVTEGLGDQFVQSLENVSRGLGLLGNGTPESANL